MRTARPLTVALPSAGPVALCRLHRPLLVAALAAMFLAPAWSAAHVLPLAASELVAKADSVVVAFVETATSRRQGKLIVTDHHLRVEELLAGESTDRLSLTLPGGTLEGETHSLSIAEPLVPGERYLLFLAAGGGHGGVAPVLVGGGQGALREGRGFAAAVDDLRAFLGGEPRELRALATAFAEAPEPVATAAVVRNPAVPPIVFRPLPASSRFSPHDRQQMAYWNLYQPDLFRVAAPTGTWSWSNGASEIAFVDDARLHAEWGQPWPSGGYVISFTRFVNGHIVESDIGLNPARPWTLDEGAATGGGGPISFRRVILSQLGRAWGMAPSFDFGPRTRESVADLGPRHQLPLLFAEDTEALRATFGGVAIRDGLVSAYGVAPGPGAPFLVPTVPVPATVRAGGAFALPRPLKIENVGTAPLVDPLVEVLLVPRRFSLQGAVLLARLQLRTAIEPGALFHFAPAGNVRVPRKVRPGVYHLAFRLRVDGDEYAGNDVAWSDHDVRLTVKRR
jgi:hypothetical protein